MVAELFNQFVDDVLQRSLGVAKLPVMAQTCTKVMKYIVQVPRIKID